MQIASRRYVEIWILLFADGAYIGTRWLRRNVHPTSDSTTRPHLQSEPNNGIGHRSQVACDARCANIKASAKHQLSLLHPDEVFR